MESFANVLQTFQESSSVFVALIPVAGGIIVAWFTWDVALLSTKRGVNSDAVALKEFLRLLREAKTEMLICDDGNKMPGSIYDNDEVVDAVKAKLESSEGFKMMCLFSNEYVSKFRRELENLDGIEIKLASDRRDVHYKIIDGGRSGYLSRHEEGESGREFESYRRVFGRVRRSTFGPFVEDINREFRSAV